MMSQPLTHPPLRPKSDPKGPQKADFWGAIKGGEIYKKNDPKFAWANFPLHLGAQNPIMQAIKAGGKC